MGTPARPTKRLLILGGTAEGRELAAGASERFGTRLSIVSALAGSTREPRKPVGALRIGGFGGIEGLTRYLRDERIDLLVDATHPFATQISAQAAEAADSAGIARLMVVRTGWEPVSGDRWIDVASLDDAVAAIPKDARRVFLTVGGRGLAPFVARDDLWFLLRFVDRPDQPIPLANHHVILGRGPFPEKDEHALLAEHRIDCLVTRASGGSATAGKLAAARALSLPVVMVARPPATPGPTVSSVAQAIDWVGERLA